MRSTSPLMVLIWFLKASLPASQRSLSEARLAKRALLLSTYKDPCISMTSCNVIYSVHCSLQTPTIPSRVTPAYTLHHYIANSLLNSLQKVKHKIQARENQQNNFRDHSCHYIRMYCTCTKNSLLNATLAEQHVRQNEHPQHTYQFTHKGPQGP